MNTSTVDRSIFCCGIEYVRMVDYQEHIKYGHKQGVTLGGGYIEWVSIMATPDFWGNNRNSRGQTLTLAPVYVEPK